MSLPFASNLTPTFNSISANKSTSALSNINLAFPLMTDLEFPESP